MLENLKISCADARIISDKIQYQEATLLEKLKFNLHIRNSKNCSLYHKNNLYYSKIYKLAYGRNNKNTPVLSDLEKQELKQSIENFIELEKETIFVES